MLLVARLTTNSLARVHSRGKAGGAQLTQLFILPNVLVDKWVLPGEGKLWKLGCHSGFVSRGNGLISITGSKANVTGDERPQLRTATTSATLPNDDDNHDHVDDDDL